MLFYDRAEDSVPVGPTEVRWGAERGDGVLLGTDVLHDDVVHIVLLDLCRKVDVDLNSVLRVLLLDSLQQRVEPLRTAEVTDYPGEVDLHPGQRYATVSLERGEHAGTLTFDSRVGFELLKLFMRYQIDFKILQ